MISNMPDLPVLLTRKEAQNILHVGKGTMLRYIHDRIIPAKKIGNKFYILREDLIDFVRNSVYY